MSRHTDRVHAASSLREAATILRRKADALDEQAKAISQVPAADLEGAPWLLLTTQVVMESTLNTSDLVSPLRMAIQFAVEAAS